MKIQKITRRDDGKIDISLQVALYKEGKYFIAYCPALELAAQGNSEEEAKEEFNDVLSLFLEDVVDKGTLERVLVNMGWTREKTNYKQPRRINRIMQGVIKERMANRYTENLELCI